MRFSRSVMVLGAVILVCVLVLLLGNVHKHFWRDATCITPRICEKCGKTEGEATGHQWRDATCTDPRICVVCGETDGSALGHTWNEATCIAPITCQKCDATMPALDHDWVDATLTTPKTCSVCGITTGETKLADVLAEAEQYAAERKYRLAIQLLDNAWKECGEQQLYDRAADYRQEFGIYNTRYIAAGKYNSLLIREDGTVNVVGDRGNREHDAEKWENIVAAATGDKFVVGLRANGTVAVAGRNQELQYTNVDEWYGVIAISAGDFHTVGLLEDGTVVSSQGYNHCGQNDVGKLMHAAGSRRIVAISAGYDHTLALLEDGTVVACGDRQVPGRNDYNGVCNVSHWQDITAICSGTDFCAGLRSDGSVVVSGVNWDMSDWNNVIGLAAGDYFLVGLREDGTVLAEVIEEKYSTDLYVLLDLLETVTSWEDIVFVAAGYDHVVGIRSDGKIVCAGSNQEGQCELAGDFVRLSD